MFFEFLEMVEGRSILTYVDKVCIVICANQKRVRCMILEFLLIVEGVKSIHHIVLVCVVCGGGGLVSMGPRMLFSSSVLRSVNPPYSVCLCCGGGDLLNMRPRK